MNRPLEPLEANLEKAQSPVPMGIDLSAEPSDLDRQPLVSAEEDSDSNHQIQAGNGLSVPQS